MVDCYKDRVKIGKWIYAVFGLLALAGCITMLVTTMVALSSGGGFENLTGHACAISHAVSGSMIVVGGLVTAGYEAYVSPKEKKFLNPTNLWLAFCMICALIPLVFGLVGAACPIELNNMPGGKAASIAFMFAMGMVASIGTFGGCIWQYRSLVADASSSTTAHDVLKKSPKAANPLIKQMEMESEKLRLVRQQLEDEQNKRKHLEAQMRLMVEMRDREHEKETQRLKRKNKKLKKSKKKKSKEIKDLKANQEGLQKALLPDVEELLNRRPSLEPFETYASLRDVNDSMNAPLEDYGNFAPGPGNPIHDRVYGQ